MWVVRCAVGNYSLVKLRRATNHTRQWRSQYRARGAECPPWQRKNCQKLGKVGKNREKIKQKRKNREEKAKIGKVISLCPSWQIGLATLLTHGYIVVDLRWTEASDYTRSPLNSMNESILDEWINDAHTCLKIFASYRKCTCSKRHIHKGYSHVFV